MSEFNFHCPHCRKNFPGNPADMKQRGSCPVCGKKILSISGRPKRSISVKLPFCWFLNFFCLGMLIVSLTAGVVGFFRYIQDSIGAALGILICGMLGSLLVALSIAAMRDDAGPKMPYNTVLDIAGWLCFPVCLIAGPLFFFWLKSSNIWSALGAFFGIQALGWLFSSFAAEAMEKRPAELGKLLIKDYPKLPGSPRFSGFCVLSGGVILLAGIVSLFWVGSNHFWGGFLIWAGSWCVCEIPIFLCRYFVKDGPFEEIMQAAQETPRMQAPEAPEVPEQIIPPAAERDVCPYCAEDVAIDDDECPHCGSFILRCPQCGVRGQVKLRPSLRVIARTAGATFLGITVGALAWGRRDEKRGAFLDGFSGAALGGALFGVSAAAGRKGYRLCCAKCGHILHKF